MNTVFVVKYSFYNQDPEFPDRDCVSCVFENEEKAKKYCDAENEKNYVSFYDYEEFFVQ